MRIFNFTKDHGSQISQMHAASMVEESQINMCLLMHWESFVDAVGVICWCSGVGHLLIQWDLFFDAVGVICWCSETCLFVDAVGVIYWCSGVGHLLIQWDLFFWCSGSHLLMRVWHLLIQWESLVGSLGVVYWCTGVGSFVDAVRLVCRSVSTLFHTEECF